MYVGFRTQQRGLDTVLSFLRKTVHARKLHENTCNWIKVTDLGPGSAQEMIITAPCAATTQ